MSTAYNSSKHKQREKIIAQFVTFTQSNEKHAINFLSQHDWKLDLAVDAYYLSLDGGGGGSGGAGSRRDSSRSTNTQVDRKKLDQIWNLYKGNFTDSFFVLLMVSIVLDPTSPDKMTQDGVCRFLQDLHFQLDDKIVLVLAWKFKAQVQGEFTREEFYTAMSELGYSLSL